MLQRELSSLGFNVAATGIYDYNTEKAVKSYQTSRGLGVDGVAGSQTWTALIHGKAPITTHKEKPAVAKVANPNPTPAKKTVAKKTTPKKKAAAA
jgi:peptidoglycan hydrolase-like protein with peptidoglycan-binding domain